MKKKKKFRQYSPIRQLVISFLFLIFSGVFFLKLPPATVKGISFIDALFTSTSAVCVTGLTVLDTAKDFTFFGQAVILVLIQLGGLGMMTFSIGIFAMLRGEMSMKWRFTFDSIYNEVTVIPPAQILKKILIYTITIEFIAALILFTEFKNLSGSRDAVWFSVFHSVSAFCNAGFSTFSDSLTMFQNNGIVISAVSFAIILGGIGFIVLTELSAAGFNIKPKNFRRFSLHSKLVLFFSAVLIFTGAVLFLMLEWNSVIRDAPLKTKFLVSFFQSVTCRTAGFNSVDIGVLRESTLSVMMALMLIGGGPGSIAGGIKVTTFAVICGLIISKLRGERQVVFWNRSLNNETIHKSMTLFIIAIFFIYTSAIILLSFHSFDADNSFLQVVFEVISAFGTVGLSTGITSKFAFDGKLLLCLVMFVGRVGPFALITAITARVKRTDIEIADENIMIG